MATDGGTNLVDIVGLAAFLQNVLEIPVDPDDLEVSRHEGGHSNETVFVDVTNRELVVRRPPMGETAESGHKVLREATVMRALADTDVPVPRIVATCEDEFVIGSEFFVMERLEGVVASETEPDPITTPEDRRSVGERMIETLAMIHDVDYESVGLSDIGRPDGYLDRQVETFNRQLTEWLLPMTEEKRSLPGIRGIGSWLERNVPSESDHVLVHGDYKPDNLMFATDPAISVEGVFDWEMSTIGDPLADLGWMLFFWHDPGDPDPGLPVEVVPTFTERDGYPSRRSLVERYKRLTGRSYDDDRFYRALTGYKLATACEAMYLRYLSGSSDDPLYPRLESGVPELVARTQRIIDGEEPL